MTQWGSCSLGEQGYSPIEILRHFYGDSIYVNTAEQISGIPASWPGSDLTIGSSGDKVRQMQEQLDEIATVYSAIPRVTPDGIYGSGTANAVGNSSLSSDCPRQEWWILPHGIKYRIFMWELPGLRN